MAGFTSNSTADHLAQTGRERKFKQTGTTVRFSALWKALHKAE
jgi:hypothetical protein